MIGNLGEEIRQHSNAYANLAQRALRRSQINALKAMLPNLETSEYVLPRGALDIGDGYVMLTATESVATYLRPCEAVALYRFFAAIDPAANPMAFCKVMRWARICLPNGQIARSLWKESKLPPEKMQSARNVKVRMQAIVYIQMLNVSFSLNQSAVILSWLKYCFICL